MTEMLGWVAGAPNNGFLGVILSIQGLKRDRSWEFGSGMVENPPTVQRRPVRCFSI